MASENDGKSRLDPLWYLMHDATSAAGREVSFAQGDEIYRVFRNSGNPFLSRIAGPPAEKIARSETALTRLFRFIALRPGYLVSPVNRDVPFAKRGLRHPQPPPAVKTPFLKPEQLRGNLGRLPWMIVMFFKNVLERLRQNPADFREVVEDLMAQFREDGLPVTRPAAYQTFEDWSDLMDTLEEIARYPAPETFDLFCAALFAYHSLAFPEEPAPSAAGGAAPPRLKKPQLKK